MRGQEYWKSSREFETKKMESLSSARIDHHGNLEIHTWQDELAAKPHFNLIVYRGKAGKPVANYYFTKEETRTKSIEEFKHADDMTFSHKAEQNAKAEAAKTEGHHYVAGHLLYRSWGYDQTNIDFYQITRVSARCVWVREVAQFVVKTTGFMSENVIADPNNFIGPEVKKMVSFRWGYASCGLSNYDGRPLNQSHYA